MKQSITDITNWQNQKALVRVDFNVPVNEATGEITDDTRIQEALPTLKYLLERGARVIVISHFGRPKGKVVESMRLTPVAKRLQQVLPGTTVLKADDVYSPAVVAMVDALQPGQLLLLENTRFEAGEEKNDETLSKNLASLGDIFVNDAFGAAHRAHSSTVGVGQFLNQRVAGLLMQKEIEHLSAALNNPARPFTAVIGGSKVSSKIGVLKHLMNVVDNLVIGGGMMFTFHLANGNQVGNSLVEPDYVELAKELLEQAKTTGTNLILADDVWSADAFDANAKKEKCLVNDIPAGWLGLDVAPPSLDTILAALNASKTVVWNGPLGVFEFPRFEEGTRSVAETLSELTRKGQCKTILGGGDTVAAIAQFKMEPTEFTHVSTGGGASLEFLEGIELPGIAILNDKASIPA